MESGRSGGDPAQRALPVRQRVLTVVDSLRRGGAERLLVTTHGFLDRARFEPAVAALYPPYDLASELRDLGVRVWTLDTSGPRDLLHALSRTRRVVREFSPDLIHTHLFTSNVAGRLAAGRLPVVTTLHNPDYSFEDTGTLLFRLRKLLDRSTGRRVNRAFVAVSEAVREDYELHMGFSPIDVTPNYLDVADFAARVAEVDRERERRVLGLAEEDLLVLHVGRFHRQKGQDVLLRAFQEAHREEPSLLLMLVGDGGELPRARVLAGELELEDRVLFPGDVADPVRLYAAADIFAFPSRWEAFGIALLEAMAAGLPVVATRTGGIPEVVGVDGGQLVEPEQVTSLALALIGLARDQDLRRDRGAAARTRAREFDARSGVQRLAAVYDRL